MARLNYTAFFLAFLLSLSAAAAPAKPPVTTLRALLIIADDYEDPEDNAIAQSIRVDLANVTNLLSLLERRQLVRVETTQVRGRNVTSKNVLSALKAMPTGPDDVVFVYFTGHGGMDKGESFLAMATGDALDRKKLLSALDAKPARLRMMIADACTNEVSEPVRTRSFKRTKGAKPDEGRFDEIYRHLLYGYQGNLYATASTEGEYAWSDDRTGGVFTKFFIRDGLLMDPAASWDTVFETARWKTMQAFSRMDAKTVEESKSEGSVNQTPRLLAAPVVLASASLPPVVPPPAKEPPAKEPPAKQPPAKDPPAKDPPANQPPVIETDDEEEDDAQESVRIENRTDEAVLVRIDRNRPDRDWTRSRLERNTLAPGASVTLESPAVVGYGERGNVTWYELEDGEFAFVSDDDDEVELAQLVDGEVQSDDEVDISSILTGTFAVDNSRKLGEVEFDGSTLSFRSRKGKPVLSGKWEVDDAQEVDGEDLFPLTLSTKEDGKRVTYSFALVVHDEETVVLVLLERSVGDRKTSIERAPIEEVLVLRRQ